MEIMELAAQLGKAIKENEVYKKFTEAKEAFDNNGDVNSKIVEYGVQQSALQEAAVSEERDEAVIAKIQERMDALYSEIFADETFVALNEAQEAVNDLMNRVNETITFNITGEQTCTHDCSTCSGCHH
jgi:cell fate (sporulation/competence/biofilm development) regulator YlbF (YheA/YmcA/DUF963 family)